MTDFEQFCKDFDIVKNALDMRTLQRWNGRDLREKENLSEHTHLCIACAYSLYDKVKDYSVCRMELVVKKLLIHDSLELLRGDILSITKDSIEGLRARVDFEENTFIETIMEDVYFTDFEDYIVKLSDLMACYKFVERELRWPSNDFSIRAYKETKASFDKLWNEFCNKYEIETEEPVTVEHRFQKGYKDDAGVDVLLEETVTFMPMSTNVINLKVKCTPQEGYMGYLCARTSAANKGLIVAQCPIDPNYTGDVLAIVHNISNSIITYDVGEAFCQVVIVPFEDFSSGVKIRKLGKRSDGNLGSTGGVKC